VVWATVNTLVVVAAADDDDECDVIDPHLEHLLLINMGSWSLAKLVS